MTASCFALWFVRLIGDIHKWLRHRKYRVPRLHRQPLTPASAYSELPVLLPLAWSFAFLNNARQRIATVSGIVIRVQIFQAKRANRRHVRHVFARFCPMVVVGIAWQNDHATGGYARNLSGSNWSHNPM
jgi:hypothetical protein